MAVDSVIKVSDVVVPRKRMRIVNHVEDLAASIDKNGLLHPIILRRDKGKLILVAGRRRLEATKLLKIGEIRSRIIDLNETQALLIEIDENLQREELTELQRAQHIAERKKVWEAMYPQTRRGGTTAARDKVTGRVQGKKAGAPKEGKTPLIGAPTANPESVMSFTNDVARKTKLSASTIKRSAQIGEGICREAQRLLENSPVEDRKDDLLKIARLDPDEQVAVATVINDGKASTYLRAKKLLEAKKIEAEPSPLPTGPFRVIVADPPWHYDKRDDDASKRENTTYSTMTIDQIKEMDVEALSADDAVLWLWTTNSHIEEAFGIVKAWGFTYKTILTWDKERIGMGDWLRGQTEHCLMCVKGRPIVVLTGQSTLLRESRGKHSVKPESFYELVESLCPGSKVELFSRQKRDGWEQWGFEAQT